MNKDIQWTSVNAAAAILGVKPVTLRRALEKAVRRNGAGNLEARVDGVVGRKFGRHWRVWLGPAWTNPAVATTERT